MNYKESAGKLKEFNDWFSKLNNRKTRKICELTGYLDLGNYELLHPDAIITICDNGEQRKITTEQLGELLNCKPLNNSFNTYSADPYNLVPSSDVTVVDGEYTSNKSRSIPFILK